MPRFFTPTDGLGDGIITIRGEDAHHIARALRMAEGDTVTVCDMQGREHTCRLDKIRDGEVICRILETREGATEPPVHITLYMAYPKGDKLETVVQKAVELGASEIVREVFPKSSGLNAVVGIALFFVVNVAADQANVSHCHTSFAWMFRFLCVHYSR